MSCESCVLRCAINLMPADFPSIRELRIQSNKLLRLVLESPHPKELKPNRLLTEGSKKERKRQGKHDALCGEQYRKVKQLFDKAAKEQLRKSKPMTNAEFQVWIRTFYSAVSKAAEAMQKSIANKMIAQMSMAKQFLTWTNC
jgi:hypothetical protein